MATVRPLEVGRAVVRGRTEGRALISAISRSDRSLRAELRLRVGPPVPFPPIPPRELLHEGIHLRADLEAGAAPPGERPGATLLRAEVALTNTTQAPATLRLGPCPLWLTGHMGGSHFGQDVHVQPPAWDGRRSGRPCAEAPRSVTLSPGESYTLRTRLTGDEVLGGTLPERYYHVHAHVALARRVLLLHAGSPEIRYGEKALSVRVETDLVEGHGRAGDSLRVRAVLRNEEERQVRIEYGACALHLRAYRGAGRSGEPVWRSDRRAPWAGTYGYGCTGYLASARLDPGRDFSPDEFDLTVPLIEVLGDSLPDGVYHFSGALRVDGDTLLAPAGQAVLRLERGSLPDSLTYRAVTFAARTEVLRERPTALRTRVSARLTHASAVTTKISAACPLVLFAYRSRERRDAAPRSGEPDARIPGRCGPDMRTIVFRAPDPRAGARPGEALPRQEPGAPVSFELEVAAADLLGRSLPRGRYFFAAAVPLEGRTVYLSAGEAEVRR